MPLPERVKNVSKDTCSRTFMTVAETLAHPAFPSAVWDLQPHQKGDLTVAKTRDGPINISWEVHGAGPVKIALIMGLAGVKTGWQRQTKHFGHDRGETYSVLIFDNRGVGASSKPLGRYTTSHMALDVLELLAHVWGDTKQVHLVGISMGGMIAQEVACRAALASLSLICTSASYEAAPGTGWLAKIGFLRIKSEEEAIRDTARKLFADEFLAAPDDASQLPVFGRTAMCGPGEYLPFENNFQRFQAQELKKRRAPGGWSYKGFVSQLMAANWHTKSPEQLRKMADRVGRERILVMHGTADEMISLPNGEKLIQDIEPGVSYIVEGMGHVPLMERTEWFDDVLERHFTACEKMV